MCAQIISIEQAIEMKNEYQSRIKPLIESYRGSGYKATEFAWIDIKTLQNYLQTLEEVNSKNADDISGIRIYFGAHPDLSASDTKTKELFSKRETIFMVPTVEVTPTSTSAEYNNLHHLPFCIKPDDASDPKKGSFEIIEDLLHTNDNASGSRTSDYSNKTSLILDRVSLTPPPE